MEVPNSRIHAVVGSAVGPKEILDAAKAAGSSGFTDIWVAEDYFLTGSIAAAGMILASNPTLRVTTGVAAMFARHPALLAMDASTLANAFEGRFRLGVGTGGMLWMKQLGLSADDRSIRRFRDSLIVIRRLLNGETVTHEANGVRLRDVQLHYPAPHLPLVVGAMGPRMLATSDELADAVVLSILCGPSYVRWATSRVPRLKEITAFAVFNLSDDGAAARQQVRTRLAFSLQRGPSPLTDLAGISQELEDFLGRLGPEALTDHMPDRWVRALSVSGTSEECISRIHELLDSGATSVGLFPIPGVEAPQLLARAGREILPAFT
jgi:alkanesulfonate monooxygenase SsuD/methylene tetrahydromethanopterin reductase-like flavin-dependent oxidoreductase (luciferase family)